MIYSKKFLLAFIKIFNYNIWFEKILFFNTKLNKFGVLGKILSHFIGLVMRLVFNCDASPNIVMGNNVRFPHAVGIVIGSTTIIGEGTVIMPNVVIGAREYPSHKIKRHATIGKNCLIGANSVIIGNLNIGDNCIIAAGARVNKDIESGTIFI